jgi:imidazole glycerol phosphate synthase glutamine amidotransferase subunit
VSRIALLDYGMGNMHSVSKALEHVGASVEIVPALDGVVADGVVVPGQGAFGACSVALEASGSVESLRAWIEDARPYLGICLGLQVLFGSSEESPGELGLGVFAGRVGKLSGRVKLPHIGWNQVRLRPDVAAFAGLEDGTYFYFDHSYTPRDAGDVESAWTTYGDEFCCGVASETVVAVQFHPEKSGEAGLVLLENFVKGCVA